MGYIISVTFKPNTLKKSSFQDLTNQKENRIHTPIVDQHVHHLYQNVLIIDHNKKL